MDRGSAQQKYQDCFGISSLDAMVAHELKSPLALLRQLSLEIEHGGQDLTREEIDILAHKITVMSEKTLRLLSNLTKSHTLQDSLFQLEPLNPRALCEDVAHEITPLIEAHGRAIQVTAKRTLPLVLANRDLLQRVLMQYIENALKYSHKHTPLLINLSSRNSDKKVRFSVRDFGPMPQKNLLNTPLQSSNNTQMVSPIARRPDSSGLGLLISRQFAEHMGSEVGVIRHVDGASFYIDVAQSQQLELV